MFPSTELMSLATLYSIITGKVVCLIPILVLDGLSNSSLDSKTTEEMLSEREMARGVEDRHPSEPMGCGLT